MKKIINPVKYSPGLIFFPMIFIMVLASISFAQDLDSRAVARDLIFTASIHSEQMSISYNGLSNTNGLLFKPGMNPYAFEPSESSDVDLKTLDEDDYQFKFGRKLKQMADCFLRYFNIDNFSAQDARTKFLMKSKVDTDKINPNGFEFNLSITVGYDSDIILKMDTIKLKSYWLCTYVNAIYHPEKNEWEFDMTNAFVNEYLLDGMKLEFQTNIDASSGALLLTMSL